MARTRTLSDALRDEIDRSGMTRYRICKEAGLSEGVMSRFMSGGGFTLANAGKVAEVLGLQLVRRKRKRGR